MNDDERLLMVGVVLLVAVLVVLVAVGAAQYVPLPTFGAVR